MLVRFHGRLTKTRGSPPEPTRTVLHSRTRGPPRKGKGCSEFQTPRETKTRCPTGVTTGLRVGRGSSSLVFLGCGTGTTLCEWTSGFYTGGTGETLLSKKVETTPLVVVGSVSLDVYVPWTHPTPRYHRPQTSCHSVSYNDLGSLYYFPPTAPQNIQWYSRNEIPQPFGLWTSVQTFMETPNRLRSRRLLLCPSYPQGVFSSVNLIQQKKNWRWRRRINVH